ncbi:MAG: 4-hydroxy-tetrahydrodipicolinate reductase [Bacteroidales bacterium]|nr:4-hydroxy-tetrahydrodipicolinate reductase [Bacteroidales bacterium]
MNIAIIGYGRMGHEIESAALARGHAVRLIVDKDNMNDLNERSIRDVDVAIEFTTPETAFENVVRCLKMKIPVVSGTTGWQEDYGKAADVCNENRTSFIHSSNFSIGVNILFRLNRELAKYMARLDQYKPLIEEIHHIKKLDAPSGTAITLAQGIADGHTGYDGWCPDDMNETGKVPVKAIREGMVPGTHTITWDSDIDVISLRHEARNRKGLALGAVVAAEYIYNRTGVFTMDQVLGF